MGNDLGTREGLRAAERSEPAAPELDDLVSMAVFAHVVETRSFSRAARRLGIAKSSVSKRVARLEDRVGATLLQRTTRELALTDAGGAMYEHARRILAEASEAGARVAEARGEARGLVRIAAGTSIAQLHVAAVLPALLARHPALEVELVAEDRFNDLVAEGLDLAIRIGPLRDQSLVAKKLGTTRLVVVASPSYLARAGTPRTPDDLRAHECMRYTQLTAREEWRFRAARGERSIAVGGRFASNHGLVLREACVAGAGVARLPEFSIERELASGALVELLGSYALPSRTIAAVYPQRRHLAPKVRAVVDHLASALGTDRRARAR